jgi:hypothetical protein
MRSWLGVLGLVVLTGDAGILQSGCGRSPSVSRQDPGWRSDAMILSGGVSGTGGLLGSSAGGSGGTTSGGADGGPVGLACPANLPPGPPWQFCVDNRLYEGKAECHDGGNCGCIPGKFFDCEFGCVTNADDAGGSCKLDIVLCPGIPINDEKSICFQNTVSSVKNECTMDLNCFCRVSPAERCTSRCIDDPDGSAHCE